MKIAVVGSGIAGLGAAWALASEHEVHIFEAAPRAGGHACTFEVEEAGVRFPVDLGFIVYNRRNYPSFCRLLDELGVETAPSSMSFSASDPRTGFEYGGETLSGLLARWTNLFDPRFWKLVAGAWRFARAGERELASGRQRTLGEFARANRLPRPYVDLYLRPMTGAIWSMPLGDALNFPAATLLTFFRQHGLLDLLDRPAWRTVRGGSRRYVEALLARLDATLHLGAPVRSVRRLAPQAAGVELRAGGGEALRFDQVVLALHSDQALALLADPSPEEREILGAIRYRESEVVLHDDASLLPRRRKAWASWNVRLDGSGEIGITYLMNLLQPLPSATPWCVTLNRTALIDPARIRHREVFAHPQLDAGAVAAQERWAEISGVRGTHYCGAYWRYGFHEDGIWSGERVAAALGAAARRAA